MKVTALALVVSGPCLSAAVPAATGSARVKIGLLDGAPIFHWSGFKSCYADDVDRALILRDFEQHRQVIPDAFVDEAFQDEVTRHGGIQARLERDLRAKGATVEDYRRFLREEIILQVWPVGVARRSKGGDSSTARAKWLASLRRGARIKLEHGSRGS